MVPRIACFLFVNHFRCCTCQTYMLRVEIWLSGLIHLRVEIPFRVEIFSLEFQLLFQAEIFDSKFLSWNSELKFFESKFSARKMSWNSELKYFWVEIFSLEKELKFGAEILESKIMSRKFPLLPLRGHTLSTHAGLGGGGHQIACRLVQGGGGSMSFVCMH